MDAEELTIGTAADGTPLGGPLTAFASTHSLWAGRSGVGKTHGLFWLCRALLLKVARAGWGLIVIDAKGGADLSTLADWVYQAALRLVPRNRISFWNPHQMPGVPGMNVFEKIGRMTAETLSEQVLENIEHTFPVGDQGDLYHPWIREWGRGIFAPLIEAGFTMAEAVPFASLTDAAFREAVLAKLNNPIATAAWRELAAMKRFDQAMVLRAITSRTKEIVANPLLAAVVGQQTTTFGWLDLMNSGGVRILKLGSSPAFSETSSQFVGRAGIDQIIAAASARDDALRRPIAVVIDEVERVASPSLARSLSWLRGHSVTFHLAVQFLGQLADESPRVLESALTNCRIKIGFSLNRRDAELLAGELWTDFGRDETIEEIRHPVFAPREVWHVVRGLSRTALQGRLWNTTVSDLRSWGVAIGDHEGWSEADMAGVSDFANAGAATIVGPNGEVTVVDTAGSGSGANAGHMSARMGSHSEVASAGGAHGLARSQGGTDVRGVTTAAQLVPGIAYDREEILAGRRTWTPEQLREQAMGSLVDQDTQRATAKFFAGPPVAFGFVEVVPPTTPPALLARCLEETSVHHRPVSDVLLEIQNRVPQFLKDRRLLSEPASAPDTAPNGHARNVSFRTRRR
jgi:hypothetical protein